MNASRLRILIPGLGLLLALCATACASSSTSSQSTSNTGNASKTAVIGIAFPLTTLDPALENDSNVNPYIFAVFDALFQFNATGQITPALALADKISADGLTHTITLRRGVKFQNGSGMTSADVKFSLERTLTIPRGVNNSYLANIGTVDTSGPYTVIIHMKRPDPILDNDLAYLGGIIYPQQYIQKVGNAAFDKRPIGTGPYEFVSQVPGGDVTLKAFSGYWGPAPSIKHIIFRGVTDPSATAAQLEAGELSFVWSLDPSQVSAVKAAGDQVRVTNTQNKIYAQFNFKKYPNYADPRIRQAFNYAINRQAIAKAVYLGAPVSIDAALDSPYRPGYDKAIQPYSYDPAKAKMLLKAAGFNFNQTIQIGYGVGEYLGQANAVEAMIGELAQIGVKAVALPQDVTTFNNSLGDFTFPQMEIINVVNDQYDNLSGVAAIYLCHGGFPLNCSAKTDSLLNKAMATSGAARVTATNQWDLYVHKNPPGVLLWDLPQFSGLSKDIAWTPTETVSYFKVTDLSWK